MTPEAWVLCALELPLVETLSRLVIGAVDVVHFDFVDSEEGVGRERRILGRKRPVLPDVSEFDGLLRVSLLVDENSRGGRGSFFELA